MVLLYVHRESLLVLNIVFYFLLKYVILILLKQFIFLF